MAKNFWDIREEQELMEKLRASDPTGKWVSDFVHSDNPKFAGKSKKERIRMALGAAYAAKRQNEESEIDEAAWGRDKMANLQAAHDRHSEKAIAANRAGDHEAVKVHQSKMGMIKTQMNKLRKEDVELDEEKHRVQVTVTDPNHTMISKRNEKMQKFVRISGDKESSVEKAKKHFSKQGYRVHGAEHVGTVNEEVGIDEAGPFSYGAKPPRKGTVAYNAMMKRKEQERKTKPIEPKDQMVGIAKVVTKEESGADDIMSVKDTYKKIAVKHMKDSMNKNATEKQRNYARTMNKRALEAMKMSDHTKALNHYRGVKEDIDGVDEGLQQTLRKVVPGYAKRQIDQKMDAAKFGKTDADKDANFHRYNKIQDKLKKEEFELAEAEFEVGHSHHKTTRMTYSRLEAKNAKDAIAKSQKSGHDLVHVYNMDKETFHHPKTGRKMQDQYNEARAVTPDDAYSGFGSIKPHRTLKVHNVLKPEKDAVARSERLMAKAGVRTNEAKSLYDRHQELRKKSGLPDPSYYLKMMKQKQAEIEALRNQGSTDHLHSVGHEAHPGAQKTFTGLRSVKKGSDGQ